VATGPGVTVGRSGSIGKAFYVEEDYWPLNTSLYVKEFRNVYPKYAYYLFEKMDLTTRMRSGTAVPTLNRNNVHPINVAIPSIMTEQKKIAEILSLVDEKLRLEEIEKKKLEKVKKSLMYLLLSGKIRIRVD
jgi:type I restriction enzyme S subunit